MMKNLQKVFASEDLSFCTLPVSVEGLRVTVGAGSCRFAGKDFEISEDEMVEIGVGLVPLSVEGHLVVTDTGEFRLFVFEFEHSGRDQPFDPLNFPNITFVHLLFYFQVPPKTKDLSSLDLTVVWVTTPPKTEEPTTVGAEGVK